MADQFTPDNRTYALTFPQGGNETGAVDITGGRLLALHVPDAFEGTTITFLAAVEGSGDFHPVYDDEGGEVKVTVAPNRIVGIDKVAGKLAALRHLKLRSGTDAAAQAQSSARTFTLIVKH